MNALIVILYVAGGPAVTPPAQPPAAQLKRRGEDTSAPAIKRRGE